MVYAFLVVSSLATGAILAMSVRILFGIEHVGALVGIGVIGSGLQVAALIGWYLYRTRPEAGTAPGLVARGESD